MIGQKEHGLQTKLAVAEVEEILERGTKEIDDHRIVVALGAEPTDKGNADTTSKSLVDLGLVLELRVLSLDGLEFDGDFLARDDVDSKVDVTCDKVQRINTIAPKEVVFVTHRRNPNQSSCPACTCRRHGGRDGERMSRPLIIQMIRVKQI